MEALVSGDKEPFFAGWRESTLFLIGGVYTLAWLLVGCVMLAYLQGIGLLLFLVVILLHGWLAWRFVENDRRRYEKNPWGRP